MSANRYFLRYWVNETDPCFKWNHLSAGTVNENECVRTDSFELTITSSCIRLILFHFDQNEICSLVKDNTISINAQRNEKDSLPSRSFYLSFVSKCKLPNNSIVSEQINEIATAVYVHFNKQSESELEGINLNVEQIRKSFDSMHDEYRRLKQQKKENISEFETPSKRARLETAGDGSAMANNSRSTKRSLASASLDSSSDHATAATLPAKRCCTEAEKPLSSRNVKLDH